MFESMQPPPPDAILGIMTLFRADPHPGKIDLSVGVYQDDDGRTPVLESVRRAEVAVVAEQDTKTYVAIAGNAAFNRGIEELVFGAGHPVLADRRLATVQTPGGSGGLSVAGHLIARARAGARIHLSDPSWPNHLPLLKLAGLAIEHYPYYDRASHRIEFERMTATLEQLPAGDVVLLHGCCHNPCGADLTAEQWRSLTALFERRGLLPLIDLAYLGLAEGVEQDAYGVRLMSERLPEALVVVSCSKNLGLYRERVGTTHVVAANPAQANGAQSNLANVARSLYSMPPDHGAAIVARILHDAELRALWLRELDAMRNRLNGLRQLLVEELAARRTKLDFSFMASERGMFSFLGLTKEQVVRLREEFHVYLVESSRVNVAGITRRNVGYVADAIAAVL